MNEDACRWTRWTTRFEWPEEGDLALVQKDRFANFLLRVHTTLDALAARLTGTPDIEALAALLDRIAPMPAPWTDNRLETLRGWSTRHADLARVLPVISTPTTCSSRSRGRSREWW